MNSTTVLLLTDFASYTSAGGLGINIRIPGMFMNGEASRKRTYLKVNEFVCTESVVAGYGIPFLRVVTPNLATNAIQAADILYEAGPPSLMLPRIRQCFAWQNAHPACSKLRLQMIHACSNSMAQPPGCKFPSVLVGSSQFRCAILQI